MNPFANPVRSRAAKSRASELYPYYAGFSSDFATDAAQWLTSEGQSSILDPWNGAGTTTTLAKAIPAQTIGYDLNPVMVVVSKSNLAVQHEAGSIAALTEKISNSAGKTRYFPAFNPLGGLFTERTADVLGSYAQNIWKHLVSASNPSDNANGIDEISPLAAAFYVGLFNTARQLLTPLSTSNPTWIKIPKSGERRIDVSRQEVRLRFKQSMERISYLISTRPSSVLHPRAACYLGDAKKLPLDAASIDSVLTSPPYCTRLDYARATLPELLILESLGLASYASTRSALMGSSVASRPDDLVIPAEWGATCGALLDQIYSHTSKASKTYYFYSHYNYFSDLNSAIGEISRVCKSSAKICIVAQDSYYKEIHNDLPKIISEMASMQGLVPRNIFSYVKKNPISLINASSKIYTRKISTTESAILLIRS